MEQPGHGDHQHLEYHDHREGILLAPTGAQEVTLSVCDKVNFFNQSSLKIVNQSQSIQRAFKEHLIFKEHW